MIRRLAEQGGAPLAVDRWFFFFAGGCLDEMQHMLLGVAAKVLGGTLGRIRLVCRLGLLTAQLVVVN